MNKLLSGSDPEAKSPVNEGDDHERVLRFPLSRDGTRAAPESGRPGRGSQALAGQIGQILVDARRLRERDVAKVLKHSARKRLHFGEAALRLGLVKRGDIDFALARQFSLPYLRHGETRVSPAVIAAYSPSDPAVEPFRALRAQIALSLSDGPNTRVTLAVVGAARGDGRSYTAANLAVVFAQVGRPTVLIDANLRRPSQHRLFGLDRRTGLSTVLANRSGLECVHAIAGLPDLHVLPAGPVPPNPVELLEQTQFAELLTDLESKFDVVILDTPAGSEGNDGPLLAQRAGAALIVARAGRTRFRDARQFASTLERARTRVVGLAFNAPR